MTSSDADARGMLDLARRAATEAGSMVIQTPAHTVRASTKSSPTDFVTEMDRAAEQLILDTILAARPDDGMVGEEGASKASQSGVSWLIDPIDGTTNYLRWLNASSAPDSVIQRLSASSSPICCVPSCRPSAISGGWGQRRFRSAGSPAGGWTPSTKQAWSPGTLLRGR